MSKRDKQFEADRRRNEREMREAEQRAQREHKDRIEREADSNEKDK